MNLFSRLFRRSHIEREVDRELRDHVARQIQDNIKAGNVNSPAKPMARSWASNPQCLK